MQYINKLQTNMFIHHSLQKNPTIFVGFFLIYEQKIIYFLALVSLLLVVLAKALF